MTKSRRFYIYGYALNGSVFYIGKGMKTRYMLRYHTSGPNITLNNFIKKNMGDIKIIFLDAGLTEKEAFSRETYYIAQIGRKDLGEGPLLNLTDGGVGGKTKCYPSTREKMSKAHKGRVFTPEWRKKISEAKKGNNPFKNGVRLETSKKLSEAGKKRKQSPETKKKIGDANRGSKNGMWGKKQSPETIEKQRQSRSWYKHHSEETKRKMRDTKRKKREYESRISENAT